MVFIMGQLHLCNGPLSLLVPPLPEVCVSVLIKLCKYIYDNNNTAILRSLGQMQYIDFRDFSFRLLLFHGF